jgi:hypothetical protein
MEAADRIALRAANRIAVGARRRGEAVSARSGAAPRAPSSCSDQAAPRKVTPECYKPVNVAQRDFPQRQNVNARNWLDGRGRGRPPREPKLLPATWPYEHWRGVHMQPLERLLGELDREGAAWANYERRCKAAEKVGLDVAALEPPPLSLWLLLGVTEHMPADERATLIATLRDRRRPVPTPVMLRDHHGRERGLQLTITTPDVMLWLTGEALAHGIACDYATPYQAWTALAELVLRDSDIGEIIARVHPERVEGRSPRLSEDEVKAFNADLARKERKRMNVKRSAFGYRAA